jgi:NADH-quinone oxidoreductase subunit L
MGLCSYLLIGFWFEKPVAYRAAIKAFMTTRVADVIMLLGIAYLYASTGTLNFRDIMYNPAPGAEGEHTLVVDAASAEEGLVIEGAAVESEPQQEEAAAVEGEGAVAEETGATEEEHAVDTLATRLGETPALIFGGLGLSAASLIGIFLIIGTIGKSAQFPLHVWLPDAMEGPTPVSAMIHAAAMVSAGVYAVIRMYPLFEAGGHPHDGLFTPPLLLMAFVGAFTALFSATIAVAQNDVKKVLAYSTISQLGFMIAALGIGAYIAAAFHLITHAFFKALLFMASGAVIHGMEHGEHHVHAHTHGHAAEPHLLPSGGAHADVAEHVVHTGEEHTAAVGDEAGEIVPVEPSAHIEKPTEHPHEEAAPHFDPQDMMNMGGLRRTMPVTFITFLIGGLSLAGFPLITAGFWSKDEILADAWYGTTHGFGPHAFVFVMLAIAAFLTAFYTMRQLGLTFWGEPRTEEARHASLGSGTGIVAITMTLPLIVLAFFAIFAGFVGVHPNFPILGGMLSGAGNPFHDFVGATLIVHPEGISFNVFPVLVSFVVALGGLAAGWLMYWREPLKAGQPDPLISMLGPMHNTLKNKYFFDELYELIFVRPSQWFAREVAYEFIDLGIIDGFLHLIARVGTWIGDLVKMINLWLIDGVGDGIPELIARFGVWFRRLQTGSVQQYMLLLALAAILIGIIFALSTGVLQAAP